MFCATKWALVALILIIINTNNLNSLAHSQDPHSEKPHSRLGRARIAPQERPSCQLQPLSAHKRRHLASTGEPDLNQTGTIQVPNIPAGSAAVANKLEQSNKKVDTSERLRQLRQLLVSNNYDAYLVTPNDEHASEYVTDYDRRLRFISGFTGSTGYAMVLLDRAILFTDGRYALQAELDLDCNWWLSVSDEPIKEIHLWLRSQGARGLKVATDARLMSLQDYDYLEDQLKSKLDNSEFALISQDLIDVVWDNLQYENIPSPPGGATAPTRQPPSGKLLVHPLEFAGQVSWQEKVMRLVGQMERLKARHYVISKLDDIAWLLNLRGSDLPMAPLFKAYLLISRSSQATTTQATPPPATHATSVEQLLASGGGGGAPLPVGSDVALQAPQVLQVPASQLIRITFYVDLKKVTPEVRQHLHLENGTSYQAPADAHPARIQLELKDYEVFIMDFRDKFATPTGGAQQLAGSQARAVPQVAPSQQGKLLLDAMANVAIHVLAKNYEDRLILIESLGQRLKSIKSELEVAGMRAAHWRDSLAIAMLLAQLDLDIGDLKQTDKWTEQSAARELEQLRSLMDFNRGQSFETISAYGANGAIVHYRPLNEAELVALNQLPQRIGNASTYLLDSGGQYWDGTTDITRTVHFGQPTDLQRESYTRVLMGAIDMMSLTFSEQSSDSESPWLLNDLIARRHLMEIGLDYAHGTGHGIGLYSLVHEEPRLIVHYAASQCQLGSAARSKLSARFVHSERSVLQANMFTSVEPGYYRANDFGIRLENIVVTQRHFVRGTNSGLRFEPLSLVPFEPKLIKLELLSNKQKAWLNSYNLMVRLRMTQQINYYLSKIRAPPSLTSRLVTTSSRLYQKLNQDNNATLPQVATPTPEVVDPLGRDNYLRLEASKLQQLLEQAHRWIMAKTELIALDVPQRYVSTTTTTSKCVQNQTLIANYRQNENDQQLDQWARLGADPEGQRLMLAYMSSAPFNDAEAARTAATLSARSEATSVTQSMLNETTWSPPASQKCAGIECDLLLLEALNSHQQALHKQRRTSSAGDEQEVKNSNGNGNRLMDLFQISSSSSSSGDRWWWPFASMWPLAGLALILTLQLAVIAYVCVGGGGRKSRAAAAAAATSRNSSRRSSGANGSATSLALVSAARQQRDVAIGANLPLSVISSTEAVEV